MHDLPERVPGRAVAPDRLSAPQPASPAGTHQAEQLPITPELRKFLRAIQGNPKDLATLTSAFNATTYGILTWIVRARISGYQVVARATKPTTYEFIPPRQP